MTKKTSSALALLRDLLESERYFFRKTILLTSFSGLLSLAIPVGVQLLLTFVTAQEIRPGMFAILGFTLFLIWLNGFLQIALMKTGEAAEERLFFQFSTLYIDKILNKSIECKERNFAKYFIEIASLQKGFTKVLFDLLFAALQLLFGIILVSFYHPFFAAFGIVLIFSLFFTLRWKFKDTLKTNFDESTQKYAMVDWLSVAEIFRKKLNRPSQEFAKNTTDSLLINYLEAKRSHFNLILRKQHAFLIFKILIIGGMLILGTILAIQQKISIGQFLAAEIIIVLVANSIEKILFSLESIFDTLTSIEKISTFNETKTVIKTSGEKIKISGAIQSIQFNGSNETIINRKDRIILTGSFKACQNLLREIDLRGGNNYNIRVNDFPLLQIEENSIRKEIAWIDHLPHILHDTFQSNIAYQSNASPDAIHEAAKLFDLEELYENMEESIFSITHHRDSIWTMENRARLECARSYVSQPSVLIIRNELIIQTEALMAKIEENFTESTLIVHSNNISTLPGYQTIELV